MRDFAVADQISSKATTRLYQRTRSCDIAMSVHKPLKDFATTVVFPSAEDLLSYVLPHTTLSVTQYFFQQRTAALPLQIICLWALSKALCWFLTTFSGPEYGGSPP
jgi:hypothetical protein